MIIISFIKLTSIIILTLIKEAAESFYLNTARSKTIVLLSSSSVREKSSLLVDTKPERRKDSDIIIYIYMVKYLMSL